MRESEARTAHHEAAHIVIARVLGCTPTSVTIENQPIAFIDRPQDFLIRDYVIFSLAGYCAAIKFAESLGPVDSLLLASEASSDLAAVEVELARLSGNTPSVVLLHLLYHTRKLVDENWPAIQKLAAKLLAAKTLNREQISEAA